MYKIVYETTQNAANVKTCFVVPGGSGASVVPQGVVPNTTMYKVCITLYLSIVFIHID